MPTSKLYFYNQLTGKFQVTIWSELKQGLWKQFNIDNHIVNSYIPASQPQKRLPVFENYTVIEPGTIYDTSTHQLNEDLYTPSLIEIDKIKLYELFEMYFAQFTNKKIAVHLSGGLDSGIIICLLHHFNIPFYLVGKISHRFEFRTEYTVQQILAPLGQSTTFIDMDDYLPFSNLSNIPLSQIPEENIKQVEGSKELARICKQLGVDIVFTGQGGDTVFVDSIPNIPNSWSCNISNEFIQSFEVEVLYPNEGLELVSPFADKKIIQAIYSLRIGTNIDPLKKWARNFFKDILPRELTEYIYSSDFFGTSLYGLEQAKAESDLLFKIAYDITGHAIFSPKITKLFLTKDVFDFEYQDYISYCDIISKAVWYNSLLREGYV